MALDYLQKPEVENEKQLIKNRMAMMEQHAAAAGMADVDGGYGNAEAVLEGNIKGAVNCCVKAVQSPSAGVEGVLGYAFYECKESYPGECKWRTCREPSISCMYRVENLVRHMEGTVLVEACMRHEAHDEADVDASVREVVGEVGKE